MLYFKHSELAKKYHLSIRTVHNWIDAAKSGKLDLILHNEGSKSYVANTARNIGVLSDLALAHRKYRNSKAAKTVTPRPEFYKIYNEHQIYDIATNLEIHHEIPRQYNYFKQGANYWDEYVKRLVSENSPNTSNSTIKLLKNNQSYLHSLLEQFKKVNIIDVGPGNALPIKDFLGGLVKSDKLGRYIALDISPSMLEIARQNIKRWFGDKVAFEGYECDINYDRFSDLLIPEYTKKDTGDSVNVVLLFGGTLSNMRYPDSGFKIVHDSMGMDDILIYADKLDTKVTRSLFDFDPKPGEARLAAIHGLMVDLLNIDSSFYKVEMGYDPISRQRFEQIRLDVSLAIEFAFNNGKHVVELNKGDSILTWHWLQQTAAEIHEQFDRNDFYIMHSSQTDSCEYLLTVSRVKRD